MKSKWWRDTHCVWFRWKVLLLKLLGQPGQLYFLTGLKIDFLAVLLATLTTRIYIPCPMGIVQVERPRTKFPRCWITLLIFPNNAVRFQGAYEWFCYTQTTVMDKTKAVALIGSLLGGLAKLEDEISLYFKVAVRTRNIRDRSFGFVKRCLKKQNYGTPKWTMREVHEISSSNHFTFPQY